MNCENVGTLGELAAKAAPGDVVDLIDFNEIGTEIAIASSCAATAQSEEVLGEGKVDDDDHHLSHRQGNLATAPEGKIVKCSEQVAHTPTRSFRFDNETIDEIMSTATLRTKSATIMTPNIDRYRESSEGLDGGLSRRVSFPKTEVTGYLEPDNPWEHAFKVKDISEIAEHYTLSCRKHNTKPLPTVLEHLKNVELDKLIRQPKFSLKNTPLQPADCEGLEEIFKRVQYESVDFSSCQLNDLAASALFGMIEYYEVANELDVSDNSDMSTQSWDAATSMIGHSRALQIFHSHGNPLSSSNAAKLGKALNTSNLHTIKLEHCGLHNSPIGTLCSHLRKNTTLKELWLAYNDLSEEDANNIAYLLEENSYLQFLDISNNNIKDEGLRKIVIALIRQATNLSSRLMNETSYDSPISTNNLTLSDALANGQGQGQSLLDTLLTMTNNKNYNNFLTTATIATTTNSLQIPTPLMPLSSSPHTKTLTKSDAIDTTSDDDDIFIDNNSTNKMLPEEELYDESSNQNNNHHQSNMEDLGEDMCCSENEIEIENSSNCSLSPTTKALDVNKNTKLNDFDDTQSADSAFESASEGDLSKMNVSTEQISSYQSTNTLDTLINNKTTKDFDDDDDNPAPPTVTSSPVEILNNHYNGSQNKAASAQILATTPTQTPPSTSRIRSHSSDSLCSDNSLDGGGGNGSCATYNEKLKKNDTLTRQKQLDPPHPITRHPNGLKALVLWNNNLTQDSGEYISDLLYNTNTLELLNIGKNKLCNDFVFSVREGVLNNKSLTNLGLQSAHLSCAGIKTLASILQFGGNCTLQRIDIRDNYLKVDSMNLLAEVLKSNKSVTQLDIDDVPKRISIGDETENDYSRVLQNIRSSCMRNENSIVVEDIMTSKCTNIEENGTSITKSSSTSTIANTNVGRRRKTGLSSGYYLSSRKISLTCHSVPITSKKPPEPLENHKLEVVKKKSGERLRSPLPSPPTVSPCSSPVPSHSPSRNRFQVSRVIEKHGSSSSLISLSPSSSVSTSPSPSPKDVNSKKFSLSPTSRFRVVVLDESKIVPRTTVPPIINKPTAAITIPETNLQPNVVEHTKESTNGTNVEPTLLTTEISTQTPSTEQSDGETDSLTDVAEDLIPVVSDSDEIDSSPSIKENTILEPVPSISPVDVEKDNDQEQTLTNKQPLQSVLKNSNRQDQSVVTRQQPVRKTSTIGSENYDFTIANLLSIFHKPVNMFNKSVSSSPDQHEHQSSTSGIVPWIVTTAATATVQMIADNSSADISSTPTTTQSSTSIFDAASKQIRGLAADFGKKVFSQNLNFGNEMNIYPAMAALEAPILPTSSSTSSSSSSSSSTTSSSNCDCDCDIIPNEMQLEIKENISPEHTIIKQSQQTSSPPTNNSAHTLSSPTESDDQKIFMCSS